ncbi:MAG: hypothetical protein M3337_02475 [Actinomycetota bacterium]|nr:hypothetical protein [Actinomycetota bacterium]
MSADRLRAAAHELYGLVPDEFTGRRDALAKEARADGDVEAAKAIKALRRPTAPAWLVNLLAREHGDDVDRLAALGEELRQAQSALDGARMKQLSADRTVLVEDLSRQVRELATAQGQKVTAAVERDVEETLRAAVVDPRAAEAVASGQLTRALAYAGLGEVDVSEATATPPQKNPSPAKKSPPAKQSPAKESRQERQAAAKRAAAEQAAVEAMEVLEAATAQMGQAQRAGDAAEARVAALQQQLDEARRDLAAAKKQHGKAERTHERSERGASAAKRDLDELLG